MRQTLAFFNYYVKMLSKDKISLFWTILFPLVLSLITYLPFQNQFETNTQKLEFLYVYWAFSIVMIFVNGVGSYFATIRQHVLLKTFFSISGKKHPFVLSIIIAQLIVGLISLTLLTVVMGFILDVFSLRIFINMLLYFIAIVPLAPAFLIIAFIPVKAESVSTILNIITIVLFILTANSSNQFGGFEWLNPLYYFRELSLVIGQIHTHPLLPILSAYAVYLIIGLFSLLKLDINSKVQRT
ncbi:hypothetical protein [Staphylococcus auricularis]|uniref:hypothetical protein n=1 Tax=Staphylococcus auricularis TaxID=29379 RepID=UPI002430411C|nr:hypothetical protein [Staphylococcus auricularis]